MNIISKFKSVSQNQSGFTLIELMVAIFIGLVVMAMAVAIVGTTNSVSLRILAKSDAQQNTRAAIVRTFDTLAGAESLETCRVADSQSNQELLKSTPVPNRYHISSINAGNCTERALTGFVIAWAQPNRVCYFQKEKESTVSTKPAIVKCIARGGVGSSRSYKTPPDAVLAPSNNPVTNIDITNCLTPVKTDPELVYFYTCQPRTGSSLNWSSTYDGPTDITLLADLSSTDADPKNDLFSYVLDGSPKTSNVSFAELVNVIAININMTIRFDNRRTSSLSDYRYVSTVVLRGSKKAIEESYNGQ